MSVSRRKSIKLVLDLSKKIDAAYKKGLVVGKGDTPNIEQTIPLMGKYNLDFNAYQDFAIMISSRAKAFQSVGIMPGNRVGILLDQPLDIIEIIMTCDLLHAIPLLLPSTQTEVELQKIIKNSSFTQ